MANQTITIRLNAITQKFNRDVKKSEDAVKDLGDSTKAVDDKKFRREMGKNEKAVNDNENALKKLVKGFIKFKIVMGIIKFAAILTAFRLLLPLLSGVSAALFAITSSAGILGGAVGFLPAMAFGMLSIFGAVKYATAGVGESLGVLLADSATAGDYAAALKKAGPVVAEFADHVNALKDMTESSRESARDNLFAGLNRAMENLRGSGIIQKVSAHFERMATIIGDVADGFTKMLGKDSVLENLGFLFDGAERSTATFGRVLTALAEGFIAVARAAAPVVEYILTEMADGLERMNASATQKGMAEFFWRVYDAGKRLGSFLGDLFGALRNISDILTSSGLRDGFLVPFENAAKAFRDFTESGAGKNKIVAWFERGVAIMDSFYRVLGAVTRGMQNMDGAGGAAVLVEFFDTISAEGGQVERLFAALGSIDLGLLAGTLLKVIDLVVLLLESMGGFENVLIIVGALVTAASALVTAFSKLPEPMRNVISMGLTMSFMFPSIASGILGVGKAAVGLKTGTGVLGALGNALNKTAAGSWAETGILKLMLFKDAVVKFATKSASALRGVLGKAFSALGTLIKTVFLGIGKAFKFLGSSVVKVAMWISRGISMAFAANPVGLIILAVIAVIALLVVLYHKSERVRKVMNAMWEWIKNNWRTLTYFMGPFGFMLRVFIDNFAAIKRAAMGVWEWLKTNWLKLLGYMGPVGLLLKTFIQNFDAIKSGAEKAMDGVKNAFAKAMSFILGLPGIELLMNVLTGGGGTSLKGWADRNNGAAASGDTSAQRGSRGNGGSLSQTLTTHRSVEKMTPGSRTISNATRGRWGGSDHHKGKALDLTGSFMGAYKKNLQAMGGTAETHGQGSGAHLHAVYPSSGGGGNGGGGAGGGVAVASGGPSGDTMRPRSPASGGSGRSIVVEGPLIGQVIANNDMDVTKAVYRALVDYTSERSERR